MTQNNNIREELKRIIFGNNEKKIVLLEPEEKEVSIHESGHFIVNQELQKKRKRRRKIIICITIKPTEKFFGANIFPNCKDNFKSKEDYEDEIAFLLAGKIAVEEMGIEPKFYEKDLLEAYKYACECVEKFYPKGIEDKREQAVVLISKAKKVAKEIIKENKDKLELIAQALLYRKLLLGEEAEKLYNGTMTIEQLRLLELD